MERIKVVVRYRNGRVVKGFSHNFFPNKHFFHLFPSDNPSARAIEVLVKELKAVFVVRDFAGNSQYNERKEYLSEERPSGRRVEVTFQDGEVLVGSTMGYNPNQPCFCVFPADPKSNNVRVFVIQSAIRNIRYLDSLDRSLADRIYYAQAQV